MNIKEELPVNKLLLDFVALDFETYTADRLSACAVGLVVVRGGVTVRKYYSLINPLLRSGKPLVKVHGLNAAMLDLAPSAAEVFPELLRISSGLPLVCHNASFDTVVLSECCAALSLTLPDFDVYDTYKITKQKLDAYCVANNLPTGQHHDALDDAAACAAVLIHVQKIKPLGISEEEAAVQLSHIPTENQLAAKHVDSEKLRPLPDDQITDKTSIFYHARTVITGTFCGFPSRDELAGTLRKLGADINTTISKKTKVVVMGIGAGPKKIEKIQEINATREEPDRIKVLSEKELIQVFIAHGMIKVY